jgi:UDP-galactopyranose mutase
VVAATGSCLEEAGGPDTLYVQPDDVEGMAQAIREQMPGSEGRDERIRRSREYVKRFEGNSVAQQVAAIYLKVYKMKKISDIQPSKIKIYTEMKKYDYLIVGSGLFGAAFAYRAKQAGKSCLVIDKRQQLGGNVYCQDVEGIHVHLYGAHIFHTSKLKVWNFVNSIVPFNRYTNSPVASYKGKLYNLPFNMNTFYQMWGVTTPAQAQAKLDEQRAEAVENMKAAGITEPRNLEEQALALIGRDVYERLIKGYTEKQWGRKCTDLPAFIIKRLPVRMIFDNNYFNDSYQGIPIGGYNKLIDGLLDGVDTMTGL